jgi:hypothetical protein
MRMIPIHKLSDAFDPMRQNVDGYIFPRGTAVLPRLLSAASI